MTTSGPRRPLLLLSLFLLLGSSCASKDSSDQTTEATQTAAAFEATMAEEIVALLSRYRVPGAALVFIHQGQVTQTRGFGRVSSADVSPITATTVFQVGSLSKPVTAMGVMVLVDRGLVDLDQPVDRYLSRWHIMDPETIVGQVTIRRILSHTAGLSLESYEGYPEGQTLPSLEESLSGNNSEDEPLRIILRPGSQFLYSGGGYTLLQLAIEEITLQTFDEYMAEEVFRPLKMNKASFRLFSERTESNASPHDRRGKRVMNRVFAEQAAAGLSATAQDLANFLVAQLEEQYRGWPFRTDGTARIRCRRAFCRPSGCSPLQAPRDARLEQTGRQ